MTADAVGGVWQYSVDLIRELASAGIEVTLVCFGPEPSHVQRLQTQGIPGCELIAAPFALEWQPDPWESIEQARIWLQSLARKLQPDVIHLNSYALAEGDWRAPVLCVAHSCVFSWWRAVHGCEPDSSWGEYRAQVSRGLQAAAAVVAPSRAMLRSAGHEYGFAADKGLVIWNFTRAEPRNTESKKCFALAAGRVWDKAKNFEVLERVAPQISWPLYAAGSGKAERQEANAPASGIRYFGEVRHEQLIEQMEAASVFVHPALYEPFGLAVLEAARARCCLVLADIPSLRELWADSAVFVNPRQQEAWVDTLEELIANPAKRSQLGEQARVASRRYSATESVRQYRELYDRLAAGVSVGGGVAA